MQKTLLALLILVLVFPATLWAQKGGSLVGSLGLGLTAAQGDFADESVGYAASSGFGIEAELRYYIFGGFSIGGNLNYMRFGSSYESAQGRVSYNFSQMGGIAKMNFINISDGKLYLTGGGGIFTPNAHFYSPGNSYTSSADESGTYYFGGVGLISKAGMKALYELEARYNYARAENDLGFSDSDVWDFIYVGLKLSFSTRGMDAPPRY
ncbi:MAG: outer membrane beta-barrel protein [Candidatus Zixiibacteriota bacterium]|nr:MAG: outer membrane beta-barrel protein [candidate division Zixibacteria bacterium]